MRRTTNSYAMQYKVGLFVTCGLLLLAAAILRMDRHGRLFTSTFNVPLVVPRADGLKAGAPVLLTGVEVGVVKRVALPTNPDASGVRVEIALDAAVAPRLKTDATAKVRSQGLLGETYIDIMPGSAAQLWQETRHPLLGSAPAAPEELFAQLSSAVTTFQGILEGVQNGRGSMGKLASDPQLYHNLVHLTVEITRTVQTLNDPSSTMGQLLHSQALYDHLTSAAGRIDSLVKRLESRRGTVGKLLHGSDLYDRSMALMGNMTIATSQVNTLLAKLNGPDGTAGQLLNDRHLYQEGREALQQLSAVSKRVDRVLARLENGSGTAGHFLFNPQLYRNLNTLIRNINLLVQDFRNHPKRYVTVKIF